MKDIMLIQNEDGVTYDWDFLNGDLNVINGNASLKNSIIHSILLHKDEMDVPVYEGKGALIQELVKLPFTDTNRDMIEETIRATLQEIDGVQACDITLEFNDETDSVKIKDIQILKDTGEEVDLGGL